MTPISGTTTTVSLGLGLLIGMSFLWSAGFVDTWQRGFLTGNDFSLIWSGPRMLLTGLDPYDPVAFLKFTETHALQPSDTAVYVYPGWVAVVLIPFGALDLAAANVAWMITGLALAAAGLAVLIAGRVGALAAAVLGFTLIASESGIVAFYSGQIDFLVLGAVALMVALLWQGRQAAAGVAGAVMLLKPQLFLLSLPAIGLLALLRGERRSALAMAATGFGLAAVSTLLLPQWWSSWLTHVATTRAADPRATTLPNALRDLLGAGGVPIAYVLLAGLVVVALAFGRSRAALPVWLTVSMSVSPYIWAYDHVVGLVPLAMAAVIRGERDQRAALAVSLAGALILVVAATLLHAIPGDERATLSFTALAQLALTVLLILSLWRYRGER